ncbi:hypothetical protein CEXT_284221 [Caerostris extrusa]|uniref:Uncharacterized protein n=1 Tax=Caerostris extrusa TaxID=172846 RepID=A0AAV4XKF0_CAEEX|nr:hypothetical protein CEXT_284221 [Caerostris extrusa]
MKSRRGNTRSSRRMLSISNERVNRILKELLRMKRALFITGMEWDEQIPTFLRKETEDRQIFDFAGKSETRAAKDVGPRN